MGSRVGLMDNMLHNWCYKVILLLCRLAKSKSTHLMVLHGKWIWLLFMKIQWIWCAAILALLVLLCVIDWLLGYLYFASDVDSWFLLIWRLFPTDTLLFVADNIWFFPVVSIDGSCWLLDGSCWLVVYFSPFWSVLVPTSHVRLLMVMGGQSYQP